MSARRTQRIVERTTWRRISRHPQAVGERLEAFAKAEQGTFLELRLAANQTSSAARAALYLRHGSNQAGYARGLKTHGEELLGRPSPLVADVEGLFAVLGERGFLAFIYHTEQRGRERFELLSNQLLQQDQLETADFLAQIARQKLALEHCAASLLLELSGSEAQVNRELLHLRRWQAWRALRRNGSVLASAFFQVCILTLFPLLWVTVALLRRTLKPTQGFVAR